MENEIKTARYIALLAHAGQVDKAGVPYVKHLKAVADQCIGVVQMVAWLHDVLEDTNIDYVTFKYAIHHFLGEYADDVCRAVVAVTKLKNESYDEYLDRVKANPIARQVKIADLKHNLDLSRLSKITEKDLERAAKYRKALEFLESEE